MTIHKLKNDEKPAALNLAWKVFMQFEAPEYSQEGIETFRNFINDKKSTDSLMMYGAFENDEIIGVIATRSDKSHISLFFVNEKYQNQGLGRKLFNTVLEKCESNHMTVNSSPYAVGFYHKLGFKDESPEQLTDGIRYTPMTLKLNK